MNNTYGAIYGGKEAEIEATTLWEAKQKAIKLFKVKKSEEWKVSVLLMKLGGKEVKHIPDF